jgi:hypothetical protein
MALTLLGIGTFGVIGMSVLCPLLACPVYYLQYKTFRKKALQINNNSSPASSLEIIIPAHNEAEGIGDTLGSIQRSIAQLHTCFSPRPLPKITIQVGADSCTDNTAQVAARFPLVSVTEFPKNRSKWLTISALVAASSADWVLLVDVGTVWPESFLTDFHRRIEAEPHALAIAPSYLPQNAGWLPQILWQMETILKKMESFCGGPISLHGATVAYQTAPLKKALVYLGDQQWFNDDVVIPLILRALNPNSVIAYPVGQVQDAGVEHDRLDIGRRKRMVLGNLQWVTALLPACFRMNPVAGIVAVRRLFRVLWAYWLACIAIGLGLAFHIIVLPAVAAIGILATLSGSFRQLAGAGVSSLLAPFRMVRPEWQLEGSWK